MKGTGIMNELATSRRKFIKAGIGAGAVLGFPTIVPCSVFGANAPSNKVNAGMFGCGGISGYHEHYLNQMDDVVVTAVCDAYKSKREAKAERLNKHYGGKNITKAHADFREILARPDIDAVFIAAHDNWHTPMSIASIRAGKDVYCQKPLALDFSLTGTLRAAVKKHNPVFQFGTQYRSMGRYRKMVELVRNGYIGKLQRIDVWCRNVNNDTDKYNVKPYGSTEVMSVPADLDFDAWQGPSHMAPYTVDRCTNWGGYHCPETSLGFITGCGIHPLGVAQWGNNSDDTSPIRYEGTGNMPGAGIYRTLEHWNVMCDYENGVKLHFMDDQTAQAVVKSYNPGEWRGADGVVFHGTKGWIGDISGGFYASDNKLWKVEFSEGEKRLPVSKEHNRNFIDCVKSREEPMCPAEMAIRCDTIGHLARAAALSGEVVKWDPKTEKLIDSQAAEKFLAPLPYRKKWKVW